MQVLLAAVQIDALHAAVENAEIALDGVGVDRAVFKADGLALTSRVKPGPANLLPSF